MIRNARIAGWGKYLPKRVLTNHDLAAMVDTSDAWIRSRTGIKERRIAAEHDTASTMGIEAGRQALEVAQLPASAVDLVIAATVTPETIFPACASLIQHGLGADRAAAFDLNAACSGFVYALITAYQFISAGTYDNILVVGSEVYSRILDWQDRNTCVLFGDGAGAVLLQATDSPTASWGFTMGSDGSGADLLYVPGLCGIPTRFSKNGHYVNMNGQEVFKFAVNTMSEATKQAIAAAGLEISDIELFIPHQANERIIKAAARSLRLPNEKVFINVDRYGNTSSASIPIALCEAIEQGKVREGDHLVLVGFGSGLSWAAIVFSWIYKTERSGYADAIESPYNR